MTKKLLLVLALVMPFILSAQEVKMGYVNSQEVLMLMPELSDVEKQMADFNEKNQKYLQDMQKFLQSSFSVSSFLVIFFAVAVIIPSVTYIFNVSSGLISSTELILLPPSSHT